MRYLYSTTLSHFDRRPNKHAVNGMHSSADDPQVTYHAVRIDSDFHAQPIVDGLIVQQSTGEFSGPIPKDTTQLTNGKHKLALRAVCNDQRGRGSAVRGLLVIPFEVLN